MCANVRLFRSLSTAHSPDTRVSHSLHSTLSLGNWSHCFCHPCFPHRIGAPRCSLLFHPEVLPGCFQVSSPLNNECTEKNTYLAERDSIMDSGSTGWKNVISTLYMINLN